MFIIVSYLMEVSDDICYGLLDLQDAYELNIINLEDMEKIFNYLCGKKKRKETYNNTKYSYMQKVSKLVAISINNLAAHAMKIFENNYDSIVDSEQPKDLKNGIAEAKKLGAYNIIETLLNNLIRATYKLYKIDESSLSFRDKRALELMGDDRPLKSNNLYKIYQRVVDYIVGMADNYAKYISNQLNGMGY